MATYTYSEAVEQTITAGEQIHQIVNGTATTEVTVEDGSKVPSIRKALLDNFYFKDPIAWQVGQTETVFNQLRQFTDGSWWYAPSATASNPVSMGSTPVGNSLWKIYDFNAIGKLTPQIREALRRSYAEAGYTLVAGSFEAGGTVASANDVMLYEATGVAYSYGGALPHTIGAGNTPVGNPLWGTKGADIFRGQVAAPGGSAIVGFQQAGAGTVPRTAQDKMREHVSPLDFGAVGDGITNDQAAFDALEVMPAGTIIDLLGKTYLIDTLPAVNEYINGFLKHSVDGYVYDANPSSLFDVGNRNVLLGGAGAAMPKWVKYRGPLLAYNVMGIGFETLGKNVNGRNMIGIGAGALHEIVNGRYNVAVGLESQYYVNSDDGANFTGTRNTSVGDNSMRFNVTGSSNIAVGRNAGQPFNGNYNSILGAGAVAGLCPQDLDDETIVNPSPSAISETAILGTNAGLFLSGGYGQILIGKDAGYNIKSGIRNIGIGWNVMKTLDEGCSYDGMTKVTVAITGTYTISGGVITISASGTGAVVGGRVLAKLGTHEQNYYRITSMPNANTIVAATAYTSITEAGSCSVMEVESITSYGAQSQDNVGIGNHVMESATKTTLTAAVGAFSCRYLQGAVQVASLGAFSLGNLQTGGQVTSVGYGAGRFMQDGTNAIALTNVTLLGANTSVSGNNQVQIGNTTTTTYVYGTVQNRSDERDKTDIQDTELGIEFIMGLRPVDGRWDMRDDYWEEYDEQVGVDEEGVAVFETRRRKLPKDGSKARARKHHWFIAQEVKELCDSLGVEFGGYQDHSINGGGDVLSLGYDEFIPPTVKAVQQCWTRLDELEKRIAALE